MFPYCCCWCAVQRYLINKNWRHINYASGIVSSLLSLLWILPFYNLGGTRNGWFTIFVDRKDTGMGHMTSDPSRTSNVKSSVQRRDMTDSGMPLTEAWALAAVVRPVTFPYAGPRTSRPTIWTEAPSCFYCSGPIASD
jgi:hypothetical protein